MDNIFNPHLPTNQTFLHGDCINTQIACIANNSADVRHQKKAGQSHSSPPPQIEDEDDILVQSVFRSQAQPMCYVYNEVFRLQFVH